MLLGGPGRTQEGGKGGSGPRGPKKNLAAKIFQKKREKSLGPL